MKKLILFLLIFILFSCKKTAADRAVIIPPVNNDRYTEYTINAGAHYCNTTAIKAVTLTEMNFKVRFDSSAIYSTIDPANQYDINKLYGFSEGIDNHVNSARIGWSWNNGALRLYAYTYYNSLRDSKEITVIQIGAENNCSIKISGKVYIFTVNDLTVYMPRAIETPVASGFQQYPYFGGDEVAPGEIHIFIKDQL